MQVTLTPDVPVPAPRFLPEGFEPSDTGALSKLGETLLARSLHSVEELIRWLEDWSEVARQVRAGLTRRRIAMTRDTADEAVRERFLAYEREVIPVWRQLQDRLNRHYLECPHRAGLDERFRPFDRRKETAASIFRDENVELFIREAELKARYSRLSGTATARFRGQTLTMPECFRHLESQDRETRAEAYHALRSTWTEMREEMDTLFDELFELRGRIAVNAGFESYRDYKFKELNRFDYGPEDCARFGDAVEKVVVPAVRERMRLRAERLEIESVRAYDLRVDTTGRGPDRLFKDQESLVSRGRAIFRAVDPVFDEEFDILVRNGLLDLMTRKGKAPGGYNSEISDMRLPFIFMNGAGGRGDLHTLLHEGGHAFHTIATRGEPILELCHPGSEFAEVASIGMEQFGLERLQEAFSEEEARILAIQNLDRWLALLPWVASVDAFQDWIYAHPGHSREEREAKWFEIRDRFAPHLDWSGLEGTRGGEWQPQLHIYLYPFYYIEYAIALIGALQLWKAFRSDPKGTVRRYREALSLGATRFLPQLFETAGVRFGMDEPILAEVVGEVTRRIRSLES